jgi:hypothetical protein
MALMMSDRLSRYNLSLKILMFCPHYQLHALGTLRSGDLVNELNSVTVAARRRFYAFWWLSLNIVRLWIG